MLIVIDFFNINSFSQQSETTERYPVVNYMNPFKRVRMGNCSSCCCCRRRRYYEDDDVVDKGSNVNSHALSSKRRNLLLSSTIRSILDLGEEGGAPRLFILVGRTSYVTK
jgi:hypothetical protein